MLQEQPSEEEKQWYGSRPFRTNRLKKGAMWHIELLLSGVSVKSNHFWATAQ
jgi:hypothetical protein